MTAIADKTLRMGAVITLVAALSSACSASVPPHSKPLGVPTLTADEGFAVAEGRAGTAGSWLTQANGSMEITGKPLSTVIATLSLTPSPCGPARVSLAGRTHEVTGTFGLSTKVSLGPSGRQRLSLFSFTPACHRRGDNRSLYVFVAPGSVTQLNVGDAPSAQPADGFGHPERGERGDSWWMIAPQSDVVVFGRPATTVTVRLSLSPTPCARSEVTVGTRKYPVDAATDVMVKATVGVDGTATLPLSATTPACRVDGDARSLYALLSGVSAAIPQ